MERGTIYTCGHGPLRENLKKLLDAADLKTQVQGAKTILIKPNLVGILAPPITTPVDLIRHLIDYLQAVTSAEIIIGEGTASARHETAHVFAELGYTKMAADKGVRLLDLNNVETVCRQRKDCRRWPEIHLPKIAYESFLLSVPVLKAHTLADVTLSLKNMMGLAPPAHYRQGSSWKKSAFHHRIGQAIADLNRYRRPDFTLLDARVGMAQSHLWGPTCEPPVGLLVAGSDPVAVDAFGAGLLGIDWREVEHIRCLHSELGLAEPLNIRPIE